MTEREDHEEDKEGSKQGQKELEQVKLEERSTEITSIIIRKSEGTMS